MQLDDSWFYQLLLLLELHEREKAVRMRGWRLGAGTRTEEQPGMKQQRNAGKMRQESRCQAWSPLFASNAPLGSSALWVHDVVRGPSCLKTAESSTSNPGAFCSKLLESRGMAASESIK